MTRWYRVTWYDARRFCDFLTLTWRGVLPKGFVVTLPSEAEWEKAARGGERIPVDYEWVTAHQLTEKLDTLLCCPQMPNPFPARPYPWGESFDLDKANTESTIGETSAIGCYPMGFSPYGCEDMSGNVWEWTRSLWGKDWEKPDFAYPYDPDDRKREDLNTTNDELRVVRGGSWDDGRDFARCASRHGIPPDLRLGDLGFRVVLRSPPIPQL